MRSIISLLAIIFTIPIAHAQSIKYFRLNQQKITYAPKNFYIKDVTDDRADKVSIGNVYDNGKKQTAAFENGATASMEGFISNVSQNTSAQPIILHITRLNFEVQKDGDTWKVDASASFTFYAGDNQLIVYNGKGQGQTGGDPAEYMESFIRQSLENDLMKFDAWWEKNKGSVATSSTIKVNVTIGNTIDVPNSIVYSPQRPLYIAEFEGPPKEGGPEMAATASGMGFGYYTETENGQMILNITITPYFDKSQSWFREGGKNIRLLAHEQLHFDITAVKACELASAIRKAPLTMENFKQLLDQLQAQNKQETNKEEDAYDEETKHGTIKDKQDEWEKKVKEQLKESGCY